MSTRRTFLIMFFYLVVVYSCNSAKPKYFGDYKGRSSGMKITLNADYTFSFHRLTHMNSVTVSGCYELKSDTLFLTYADRIYDSTVVASLDLTHATLSQALGYPKKLLWKKKKLFIMAGSYRLQFAKYTK